jgi:hypothetical protein
MEVSMLPAIRLAFVLGALSWAMPLSVHAQDNPWLEPAQDNMTACAPQGQREGAGSPLRVQVRDQFGPYRSDQVVTVSAMNGLPLVTLACNGAVDVFRLAPGSYRVQAFVGDVRSPEVALNVPPSGSRVVLTLQPAPNLTTNSPAIDYL